MVKIHILVITVLVGCCLNFNTRHLLPRHTLKTVAKETLLCFFRRKSHLKFLRSGVKFPHTPTHTRFPAHILNQVKFFRVKSEIKDFENEGARKFSRKEKRGEGSWSLWKCETRNKSQHVLHCVVHTFMLRHPFLQMEKRLPFNFPFANTDYFYLRKRNILEFSWRRDLSKGGCFVVHVMWWVRGEFKITGGRLVDIEG